MSDPIDGNIIMGEKLVVDSTPTEGAVLSVILQDEQKEPNKASRIPDGRA